MIVMEWLVTTIDRMLYASYKIFNLIAIKDIGILWYLCMIKFGNLEFKFGIIGPKLTMRGEEHRPLVNHKVEVIFTFTLG